MACPYLVCQVASVLTKVGPPSAPWRNGGSFYMPHLALMSWWLFALALNCADTFAAYLLVGVGVLGLLEKEHDRAAGTRGCTVASSEFLCVLNEKALGGVERKGTAAMTGRHPVGSLHHEEAWLGGGQCSTSITVRLRSQPESGEQRDWTWLGELVSRDNMVREEEGRRTRRVRQKVKGRAVEAEANNWLQSTHDGFATVPTVTSKKLKTLS
ncbi:hypothetical protein B0H16DRAFT_1465446 [Mycena metata]|uniref:Uncharacterized protein n=1 Tax=Mycena metata TaxID=1033252 RepID=A0AAD7ICV2_9AGAR|nr:hypothetical protein B0H16DRAFT_1465446 [Mycena metata]